MEETNQVEATEQTQTTETQKVEETPVAAVEQSKTDDTNESKIKNGAVSFYRQKTEAYKKENEDMKAQLQALLKEKDDAENQKLKEQNRFEELYKKEKERAEKANLIVEEMRTSTIKDKKEDAIMQTALSMGLKESYKKFLDTDTQLVQIETTDAGRVNVLGVEDYLQEFKQDHPELFHKQGAPKVNNATSTTIHEPTELSWSEIVKLEASDPARYKEEMKKRLKVL